MPNNDGQIKIVFITVDGGGHADDVYIDRNTTVEQFIQAKMGYALTNGYAISVNRRPVTPEAARTQILHGNDRVSVAPRKQDVGDPSQPQPTDELGDEDTGDDESPLA